MGSIKKALMGRRRHRLMTGNECPLKADICESGSDCLQHRQTASEGYGVGICDSATPYLERVTSRAAYRVGKQQISQRFKGKTDTRLIETDLPAKERREMEAVGS